MKGSYFADTDLSGNPAFERLDQQLNFKWTLYSPNPEKLQPDQYSVRWKGQLEAPETGKYQVGLRGNDGFRMYLNGKLMIDQWEKLSYSTKTVEVDFAKGQKYDLTVEFREDRGEANIELVWNYGLKNYQKDFSDAVKMAQNADYIIIAAGIHEGEFQDLSLIHI